MISVNNVPIKDPILNIVPCIVSLLLRLIPMAPDLIQQALLGSSSSSFSIDAFVSQERRELRRVPVAVRCNNFGLPILLDQVFQVFAIRRLGVGNIVVREPAL